MNDPRPLLLDSSPLEVTHAQTLFAQGTNVRRHFGGLQVHSSGRILLTFMYGTMPRQNDGVLMLSVSDDRGESWSRPRTLLAVPGWDCFATGGACLLPDGRLRLYMGRYQFQPELGGSQPFGEEWFTTSTESFDGGETWSQPTADIKIFPGWNEFYGGSNPVHLRDGRLMWAVSGTQDRDLDWRVGVTFSDSSGETYSAPVIVAAAPDMGFGDGDIIELRDGRFLCIVREHLHGGTMVSRSGNDGQTWSALQPIGFVGAGFKLNRLESGLITCLYRDEDPERRGVSLAVSADEGESWDWAGRLYAAPSDTPHLPGYFGGCPDMESLGNGEYAVTLHTYADDDGEMCIQFLRLRER